MGGLSRRAYILNKIKQEEAKPVVVVDAGAMLFPQFSIPPSLFAARTVQAGGLIEAMAAMGIDAVGLAPLDLSAGTDFLRKQAGAQLPWVSMNLVSNKSGEPFFAPYIIKKAGDLSVGILGLTGHLENMPNQTSVVDYQTIAWEETLAAALEQIKDQVDMVILLSSLPEHTNQKIAENFSDIHLIIMSGQSTNNKHPQLFGNTLIAQINSRGKHLGRLDVDWQPSRTWQPPAAAGAKSLRDRLDRTNWQLGRLAKRYVQGELKQNAQYKQLLEEKDRLTAELTVLEDHYGKQEQFSTYNGSVISLPVSLPEVPEIQKIVLATKLAVNKTNQGMLAKSPPRPQEHRVGFSNMAGWKACQSCHQPQTAFWQQTAHAKAWQTLEKVDQQFNPECLICHVTLPTYDQDIVTGQNLLADLKDEFKTIGCETCHGPSRGHTMQPDLKRPVQPDEQTCLHCHTPERDDNFVYSEKLEKIRCPASGP